MHSISANQLIKFGEEFEDFKRPINANNIDSVKIDSLNNLDGEIENLKVPIEPISINKSDTTKVDSINSLK